MRIRPSKSGTKNHPSKIVFCKGGLVCAWHIIRWIRDEHESGALMFGVVYQSWCKQS